MASGHGGHHEQTDQADTSTGCANGHGSSKSTAAGSVPSLCGGVQTNKPNRWTGRPVLAAPRLLAPAREPRWIDTIGLVLTIARTAWLVLVYNLGVIAWGAYVRATGSGAGCGAHWPLCDGRIIPRSLGVATLIEYSHRITSGLALLSVLALLWWVRKSTPPGHPARLGALMSVVFMLTEAAVGAGLVLFELVADNASMARALFMAVHLTNTFVLIAWLALTAWWLSGGEAMTPAATPGRTAAVARLARGRDRRRRERRHCGAGRHAVPVEDACRGARGRSVADLAHAPATADAAPRARDRHGRLAARSRRCWPARAATPLAARLARGVAAWR